MHEKEQNATRGGNDALYLKLQWQTVMIVCSPKQISEQWDLSVLFEVSKLLCRLLPYRVKQLRCISLQVICIMLSGAVLILMM